MTTDSKGASSVTGVVAHFNCGIKAIHVHMDDFSDRFFAHTLAPKLYIKTV
jgi:isochorismate hydrolase